VNGYELTSHHQLATQDKTPSFEKGAYLLVNDTKLLSFKGVFILVFMASGRSENQRQREFK
jgi:uncharacterized protein involved in tellurium resistance